MSNPFSKGWKYMMSSFDKAIEDNADPKVQIHQAAQAAREQHQQIQEQAASVIGNRNQLEMKLGRLKKERDKLDTNTRAALDQAGRAAEAGDATKAQQYEASAETFASQLISVEQELEDTAAMHEAASRAAEEAQTQAKRSQMEYQQLSSQIRELESQADQAKMQEQTSAALDGVRAASKSSGPSLDEVRDKIESRYANALGAQELAGDSVDGKMAEIESSMTDFKASSRLEEIRAQMKGNGSNELSAGSTGGAAGEIEGGTAEPTDDQGETDATGDAGRN